MWLETQNIDRAVEVLDEGLAMNPGDLEFLRARARTCFTGERWPCAVESLGRTYEFDQTLVGDSSFYRDILGAAELSNDTLARLRWTEEAVTQLPNSLRFWAQRAAVLTEVGDNDAALLAYRRISELDPDDTRAPLGAASIVIAGIVIDSVTPLDTMALFEADSLMTFVAVRDSNMHRSLAAFYFQTPFKMIQARPPQRPDIALDWLEKAIQYDVDGRNTNNANFFYGIAAFLYLNDFFTEMQGSESCELAERYNTIAGHGLERLTASASVAQSTADAILPGLGQHMEYGPQFVAAYCTSN
jgi:tetratricopeptide (TPR) repeat protein